MDETTTISNIFNYIPYDLADELTQGLLQSKHVKIERIVSRGHCSTPGFWYDQKWDEWVLLIKGKAEIEFKGQTKSKVLRPGDHMFIPAHVRHRVAWTAKQSDTVWLAVHIDPDEHAALKPTVE